MLEVAWELMVISVMSFKSFIIYNVESFKHNGEGCVETPVK